MPWSFLTSIGNLQNYTISRLLPACYLCTSMGTLIAKACWIILLLYLLFFNANTELKQQSRGWLSLEKNQRHLCRRELSENHQNPFSITTTDVLHTDLCCQGILKQNLDRRIVITRTPNQNLTTYHRLPVNYATRQYE